MCKNFFKSYARRVIQTACCVTIVGLSACPTDVAAEVWPNDITEAQVLALAQQKQFKGSGKVTVAGSTGSGVAIAPGWVLTAAHVVRGRSAASFTLDGVTYNGVPVTTDGTAFESSDVALIKLNANAQLPASTVFIAPNANLDPVGSLVWKAGRGQSGTRRQANLGQLQPADNNVRAGTNIATARRNNFNSIVGVTDLVVFQRENSGANLTDFEITTAPGDSGGAMYYQHNNQWYIAGTTVGAQGGVGFIDADVSSVYTWIESETGLTFVPQAAPTELTFDSDFTIAGVQNSGLSGFGKIWDNTRPMFTGGADGFNYTWENDFAPVAVFGTATTEPQVVGVQSDITFGGIRFDATSPTGNAGPFQITDGGGTLQASLGGATIETNRFSAISAALTGNGTRDITKTGDADLLLNGNSNGAFDAEFTIADGTLIVRTNSALGTGGFNADVKTTVADGASLELGGTGVSLNEHLHIFGMGHNGNGAIDVDVGDHILTERIAVRSDSGLDVSTGASLTIGGAQGRFYRPAGETPLLTQTGGGTVVYDNISNLDSLTVSDGVAAGNGGINGIVSISGGAELRVGDSAMAEAIGSFQTGDFTLDSSALLTIDIDPLGNTADLLNVNGMLNLNGILGLNLESAPKLGQSFLIIENDFSDLVSGMFSNGSFVSAMSGGEDYLFAIDYAAGSGNDVRLTSVSAVPEPSSTVLLLLMTSMIGARRHRAA